MSNIQSILDSAELSVASYSPLLATETRLQVVALQDEGRGMSFTQATAFASRFPDVITQYADTLFSGGMGTGLNATVFAGVSGKLTLAIRGTEH